MILDHVDKLELPDDLGKRYGNQLYTLRNLAVGLDFLYRQVARVEAAAVGPIQGKLTVCTAGNIPGIPRETLALVTCAFHWYAVSACNYVWLVGWLARQADQNQPNPHKYANDVMPAVVKYRHKVAAHLATLEPRDDNPADLTATLLFPITLTDEGFHVGGNAVTIRKAGEDHASKHDLMWFLTKTHRELARRYWPNESQ